MARLSLVVWSPRQRVSPSHELQSFKRPQTTAEGFAIHTDNNHFPKGRIVAGDSAWLVFTIDNTATILRPVIFKEHVLMCQEKKLGPLAPAIRLCLWHASDSPLALRLKG